MLKKIERKIIYWKNWLLYGKSEAEWWNNFYLMADELSDLLDNMLCEERRSLKGIASCKNNKLKKEA